MKPPNLHEIPFSKTGSYLKITAQTGSESGRLMIATARTLPQLRRSTDEWAHDFFEIALTRNGSEIRYVYEASPSRLILRARRGEAVFAFLDDDTLCFKSRGINVKLIPCKSFGAMQWRSDGQVCLFDYTGRCQPLARAGKNTRLAAEETRTVKGSKGYANDTPYAVIFTSSSSRAEGAVRFQEHAPLWEEPLPPFAETERARRSEYREWQAKIPDVSRRYKDTAQTAWYILWNSLVNPEGPLTRRAVLMSKNWMNKVWSWDNCFNALALAAASPELAFDQLRLMFDNQAPTGAFPDSVTSLERNYCFVKPPIFGWTLMRLADRLGARRIKKFHAEAYEPICRQTEFWFRYRDTNKNGMCEYLHGNDSGWDNSTVFDQGCPVEAADLAAHLVMQMEGLAQMAAALGKKRDESRWRRRSREQLERLLDHGLIHNRFVSPLADMLGAYDPGSLLNYIPIILGSRLPGRILRRMVKDLSPGGFFLTEHGLATQRLDSKAYTPNGYWRGPIWAPSTYLIFDGLLASGEKELATLIAKRFCNMCARDSAMWENYDAATGDGLCCPAYTWTASVFLLLAEWLRQNQRRRKRSAK